MAYTKPKRLLPTIIAKDIDPTSLMDAYINRIKTRLTKRDEDYRAVFLGNPGMGKSVSSLSLCYLIDPEFNMERCFFRPSLFVKYIRDHSTSEISRRKLKGKMILFDEAGVGMFSRQAQSKMNKIIAIVSQTQRYLNAGIIYTLPSFGFLDAVVRKMLHQIYVCVRKSKYPIHPLSYAEAEVYDIMLDAVGIQYYKRKDSELELAYPMVYVPKYYFRFRINKVRIHLPPKKLLNEYQLKKKEEMALLYQKLAEELESGIEEQDEVKFKENMKVLLENILNDYHLLIKKDGTLSPTKIQKMYGVSKEMAEICINFIMRNNIEPTNPANKFGFNFK